MIVPLPSVVVVVVVVSDTCAHAKGATTAKATLSSILLIVCFLLSFNGANNPVSELCFDAEDAPRPLYVI